MGSRLVVRRHRMGIGVDAEGTEPCVGLAVRKRGPLMARRPDQAVRVDTLAANLCPGRAIMHFTSVDHRSHRGSTMAVANATASSTARSSDKLVTTVPFRIEAVQVDGGSEFMAEFETACRKKGFTLAAVPPKPPKMNGRADRMQANGETSSRTPKAPLPPGCPNPTR